MTIRVRLFASVREDLGISEVDISPDRVATAGDVWNEIACQNMGKEVLVAVNQNYADASAPVKDGDEVAFFPPVTGG